MRLLGGGGLLRSPLAHLFAKGDVMPLHNFHFRSGASDKGQRRPSYRRSLALEPLENRCLLSAAPLGNAYAGTAANLALAADVGAYQPQATAVPVVTAITPSTGSTAGGTTVTIAGTGLTGATAVKFGTVPGTAVNVVSDIQLTVTSPAGAAGTVGVTVTTPGGTSTASAGDTFTYTASAPTVTGLSPTSGSTAGGTTVTITGSGFTGATAVKFGTVAGTSLSVVSDTQITVKSPAGLAGSVDVTVTTPGGTSATGTADKFTYAAPAPTVTGLSPTSGSTAGGTTVTITGSGFTGATAVKFGTVAGTSLSVVSDTQITVKSPAGSAGAVDVTVTTPGGTSTTGTADKFTYATPAPTVTGLSPTSGSTAGGTTVTVTGSGFTGATAVKFGTVAGTSLSVVSDTQITVKSPAGSAGSVDVTVTTPGGTSATGTVDKFTYAAAPTVTSLNPTSGTAAGGTTVTIAGTNLTNATAVNFGDVAVTAFQSDTATQIVLAAPAGAAGVVDVTVTTAGGTSATSSADRFTYPAASDVSTVGLYAAAGSTFLLRNSDDTGIANTTVTYQPTSDTFVPIVGDWAGDGKATLGLYDRSNGTFYLRNSNDPSYTATDATFQYGPSSTDSTWIPVVGDWTNSGKAQVGLYNQTTGTFHLREVSGSTVNDVTFMLGPTSNSLLPIAGKWTASVVGDAVGLYDPNSAMVFLRDTNTTGEADSSFLYGSPVYVGGSQAGQKINWQALAGDWTGSGTDAIGLYDPATSTFYLRNSNTSGFAQRTFVYGPASFSGTAVAGAWNAPALTAVSPGSGSTAGGTTVTLSGTGFTGATGVKFGGVAGTSLVVVSDTQITVTSPAGAAGAVGVAVTTAGGNSAISTADQFTYAAAPAVASISPSSGSTAGGTAVTITGTGFTGATGVKFGTVAGASVDVVSDTEITLTSPAGSAGAVDVTVTTPIGTSPTGTTDKFTYGG
jgi:glutamate dehydrogenase/leucine dehydrogenase